MSAAKYLAKKGHKVELFEKEDKPGGQRGCRTFIEALKDEKGNMQIFSGMVLNAINK
ncbi:MAG: Flavin containing amine oxidoreductase [Clostridia bacterium]|nr:Flavin containing amine oxidoreductase [Clostridia bacterium]